MLTLTLNGKPHQITTDLTVRALLAELQLPEQLVVIEYNGDILHRQHWGETQVQEGDRLEVVTVVGGG
ncbi:sulfur carrier protein ThiS [Anthocerotibacter panamensis]|uniref:sulfur carrier protein ThiS n=1 Tax=Anthocerotibacter panamensis TaxID=2857077 RepID=UPI001C404CEE|nr:sulfur carrier protein ThiS [Anthocerotibacter panamensis]